MTRNHREPSDEAIETLIRIRLREIPVPDVPNWQAPPLSSSVSLLLPSAAGVLGVVVIALLAIAALVFGAPGSAVGPAQTEFASATGATGIATPPSPSLTPYSSATPRPSPSTSGDPAALDRAIRLALADEILAAYLIEHAHGAPVARWYSYTASIDQRARAILVTMEFDNYADDIPLDSCDIYRAIDHVAGVAWLVNASGTNILARSPVWPGGVRCV